MNLSERRSSTSSAGPVSVSTRRSCSSNTRALDRSSSPLTTTRTESGSLYVCRESVLMWRIGQASPRSPMAQPPAETNTPEETEAMAAELARSLRQGDVVLVSGELGAGKTTFVRGACRALGVSGAVTSPTYTIGQVYAGREAEIAHLDLYRLDTLEHEDPALLDDYLAPQRIGFVEWPAVGEPQIERVRARVTIEHAGGDRRAIRIDQ